MFNLLTPIAVPLSEPPTVPPIEISLTASGKGLEVQLSATRARKIRVILRDANHGRRTQLCKAV